MSEQKVQRYTCSIIHIDWVDEAGNPLPGGKQRPEESLFFENDKGMWMRYADHERVLGASALRERRLREALEDMIGKCIHCGGSNKFIPIIGEETACPWCEKARAALAQEEQP